MIVMDVAALVEAGLDQAGTAVAVIAPAGGSTAWVLRHVNGPFARLFGLTQPELIGKPLVAIKNLVADQAAWAALLEALQTGTACQIELRLRPAGVAAGVERWLGMRLAFGPGTGPREAVSIGRDITDARRITAREESSRRLLASIFTRVSAPIAIVATDGTITMSNPAFHQLLGMTAAEAQGLRVDELTPPAYAQAARAARAKQLIDGERYEMGFETLAKGGAHVPVWLTSVLLRDGDQRFRVVTLMPLSPNVLPAAPNPPARDVGELRAISLGAFRTVFGDEWERIAMRAMLKAEQIIKRRLGAGDLVSRNDDHKFVIWFDSKDTDRNEAVLNGAVREIRLRFLTDFGEEAAAYVSAAVVPGVPRPKMAAATPTPPLPTRNQFEKMLRARQRAP